MVDAAERLLERLVAPREISLKVSYDLLYVYMCHLIHYIFRLAHK
jgi:hypothetical protein